VVLPYILSLALAYACSLSSRVFALELDPVCESSVTVDPGREEPLAEGGMFCARCMILIFGGAVSCVGARSARRNDRLPSASTSLLKNRLTL
jgi:hypothetical protein